MQECGRRREGHDVYLYFTITTTFRIGCKGRLSRLCAVLGSMLLLALALPGTVSAHTFLVQSSPQAGQRLGVSPRTLSLQFSEAVAARGAHMTVTGADGHVAPLGLLVTTGGGTDLSAALPHLADGVYVVTWQVVSADDGHLSAGYFSFGVGNAAFPTLTSGVSATTSWPQTLASWLALLGLSLSAGGLLSEMLIWRPLARVSPDTALPAPLEIAAPTHDEHVAVAASGKNDRMGGDQVRPYPPRRLPAYASSTGINATPAVSPGPTVPRQMGTMPRALLYGALLTALVGASWSFVLMAGALQGSGPLAGLSPSAWWAAARTPAGALALAAVGLTLYALVALCVLRVPAAAVIALVAAAATLALRSHPAATRAWWDMLAIVIHVALAVLWVGLLAHLVVMFWLQPASATRAVLHVALRRYARVALWSVALVGLTGVVAALTELHTVDQVVTTPYGRVLVLKTALVALALLLALAARLRGLRGERVAALLRARRLTRVEVLTLVGVLGVAAWLGNVAPPYSTPSRAAASGALPDAPAPVGPALYVAGQAGWLEVYVTASAGRLTVQAYAPGGAAPQDAHLSLRAQMPGGRIEPLAPQACGPGCFTTPLTWQRGSTRVHLQIGARDWDGGALTLAVPWPPLPRDPALLAQGIATMRAQRAVVMSEQITSGPHATAHSVYHQSGAKLMDSEPYTGRVSEVRRLPSSDGLTQLVLYLPGSSIWAHLWVDAQGRLRREVLVPPSYLIQHTFSYPTHGVLQTALTPLQRRVAGKRHRDRRTVDAPRARFTIAEVRPYLRGSHD